MAENTKEIEQNLAKESKMIGDEKESVEYHVKGPVSANYYLHCLKQSPDALNEKEKKALFNWFKEQAEKGDIHAQYNYAAMLFKGDGTGVGKDVKTAIEWFRKSAELGNSQAQYFLGTTLLQQCEGISTDEKEAAEWIRKAAIQGHVLAQLNLGIMLEQGQGVRENKIEAADWYKKAALQGNSDAQYYLAKILYNHFHAKQEALEWLRKAEAQGHTGAQLMAALLSLSEMIDKLKNHFDASVELEKGRKLLKGTPEEKKLAAECFRKLAIAGVADAQVLLAGMYYDGTIIPKDLKEAVGWYQKAVDQGDSIAKFFLGRMLLIADGIPKNEKEGVRLIRESAEAGDYDAQLFMYTLYHTGENPCIPKDLKVAAEWCKKSAAQGNAMAQFAYGLILSVGEGTPRDEKEAMRWIREAAEKGYGQAQCELGKRLTDTGLDPKQALEWFKKAANQGNSEGIVESSIEERIHRFYGPLYSEMVAKSLKTIDPRAVSEKPKR